MKNQSPNIKVKRSVLVGLYKLGKKQNVTIKYIQYCDAVCKGHGLLMTAGYQVIYTGGALAKGRHYKNTFSYLNEFSKMTYNPTIHSLKSHGTWEWWQNFLAYTHQNSKCLLVSYL